MATENLIRAILISPHTDIMYVHVYVCAYMYVSNSITCMYQAALCVLKPTLANNKLFVCVMSEFKSTMQQERTAL